MSISKVIRIVMKKKASTSAPPIRVKVQRSSRRSGNCAAALSRLAIALLLNAPTNMVEEITFAGEGGGGANRLYLPAFSYLLQSLLRYFS